MSEHPIRNIVISVLLTAIITYSVAYFLPQKPTEVVINDLSDIKNALFEMQKENPEILKETLEDIGIVLEEKELDDSEIVSQIIQVDYFINGSRVLDGISNTGIIYNGEIYSPIKSISQLIGKGYHWDGVNNSIYIGRNTLLNRPSIWLDDMDYFNYQSSNRENDWFQWESRSDTDSTGIAHEQGIRYTLRGVDGNWQYTEYLLNQKYSSFKGKFVLHHESRSETSNTQLKIYGDDNLLYTSPQLTSGVLPIDFEINTSGILILRIDISNDSTSSWTFDVGIVDAGFYE